MTQLVKQMITNIIDGDHVAAQATLSLIVEQKIKDAVGGKESRRIYESTAFSVDGLQHSLTNSERSDYASEIKREYQVDVKFVGSDEMTFTGTRARVRAAVLAHYDNSTSEMLDLHPELKESRRIYESTAFQTFAKPNHLIASVNSVEDSLARATAQYVFKQIKGEDKTLKIYCVDKAEDRTYKKLLRQLNLKPSNLTKPFLMNAGYEFKLVKSEVQTFYSAEHRVVIVLDETNPVIYFSAVSDDKE